MEREMVDIESQTNHQEVPNNVFHKRKTPVTLKFEDVVYKIKIENVGILEKKKKASERKVILNGVSGIVQPGEILAMLGPSGSGKTTLLTALGGRLGGRLKGKITYNGDPFSNAMKRNTGFVTQDDVLHPHLTVTETLVFTALLRLPNTVAKEEKVALAKAVMNQLGLVKCKDSIVGGPGLRGVSGGERKRVSVGQELLINPSLLFLDEPTSGLDSTTALRLVSTLFDLARGGRTIVMTIHQPSSRLYYMFTKVLLLSEGNTVYFGKGSEALDYFSGVGFSPALAMNPADFLLDLANGIYTNELNEDVVVDKKQLIQAYKSCNADSQLRQMVQVTNSNSSSRVENTAGFGKWPTNWWQQFTVLLRRDLKERKHEAFASFNIIQVVLTSFIVGLLWYKSDTAHMQDQLGLLFFLSSFWAFYPLYRAIFVFPDERVMLEKERSSGMYRLSSYFMAKMTVDLPMELVLPTVSILITYWMAGLKATAAAFIFMLLTILTLVLVSQGIGLALGACVQNTKVATTFASVIGLTFMITSGFFVQNVPKFIAWLKYISFIYYANELVIFSQYREGETYKCGTGKCLIYEYPGIKGLGFVNNRESQLRASLILLAMLFFYRFIAYVALMRIGVTKKSKSS
ncbi:hypothetical protein HN51_044003 [Arachis hypogaea]|uniref:ABC transporter domain-containing protein n=1 Tax=Arachis hypogaea TaxID=3818 RepID=A0A444Y4K0_ARAHY|nr:ABC transporter G family member 9 [Arachis ipaensis]XP_025673878.1 ABC transporter G family member 9 [Arachis hypogaea]QHN96125.1 ABC transporter G family member [Arachis hypogaea]RYQ96850.1 hypothetical protein Ahy_B08g092747 [Arachis hypogaea]